MSDPLLDLTDRSVAVMLCPFRLCSWQSPDVRTLGRTEQDEVVRDHLLGEHREQLDTLAHLLDEQPGDLPEPRWTASDGDTRACLVEAEHTGALDLVVEDGHHHMRVRLPDQALGRGAKAVGRYLIERAPVGPLRADELRRDLITLTEHLAGDEAGLRP